MPLQIQTLNRDCLEALAEFPEDHFDVALTDPPYGLEFMGKQWDKWEDSFNEKWGAAVHRVLKPGAFLVFTMTPRQDLLWRCLAGMDKAGFQLTFSGMYWLYHGGFPKCMNVTQQIDKLNGKKGEIVGSYEKKDAFGGPEAGESTGFIAGYSGHKTKEVPIVAPESEDAKKWTGWKSYSIKPCLEPIVVCQKPLSENSIAENVLKHGAGAVNVDAARIPYTGRQDVQGAKVGFNPAEKGRSHVYGLGLGEVMQGPHASGRFPSNLLVSGEPIGSESRYYSLDAWARKRGITVAQGTMFFDVPKPAKAEKEENLEEEFERQKNPESGRKAGSAGTDNAHNRELIKAKNWHPTVKPVKLYCYLMELFCKRGGKVLDPFMGSGTTGIACSKMGREFVGIEKNPEYFKIALARLKEHQNQTRLGEWIK